MGSEALLDTLLCFARYKKKKIKNDNRFSAQFLHFAYIESQDTVWAVLIK